MQLKMWRPADLPIPEYPLAEGFSIRLMREGEEAMWSYSCLGEFNVTEVTEAPFQRTMGDFPQDHIYFVCNKDDHPVATASCQVKNGGEPFLHYIAVNPDYRGHKLAKGVEVALFLCPECKSVGGISGRGNVLRCTCGMKRKVTQFGTFEPAEPFENMAQWNEWQHDCLKRGDYVHGEALFADEGVTLMQLDTDMKEQQLAQGSVTMLSDVMTVGEHRFPLSEITDMALIQRKRLAFMCAGNYYELRAAKPKCLRKYCAAWKNAVEAAAQPAANS